MAVESKKNNEASVVVEAKQKQEIQEAAAAVAVAEAMKNEEASAAAETKQTQELKEAEAAVAVVEAKINAEAEAKRTDDLAMNEQEQEFVQVATAVASLALGGACIAGGLVVRALKPQVMQRYTLDDSACDSTGPVEERIVEYPSQHKVQFKGFSASHLFPNEPNLKRGNQTNLAFKVGIKGGPHAACRLGME